MKSSDFEAKSAAYHARRNASLKKELEETKEEAEVWRKKCFKLEATVEVLIEQLEAKPTEGGYNLKWSWIDKIVFILKEAGRPMLSSEIIAALSRREEAVIASKADRVKYFSAFLNTALKYERVLATKQRGTRGYFYSLPPDSVNKSGEGTVS